MDIKIDGVEINGNKQLDSLLKFEKELDKLLKKYILPTEQDEVNILWRWSIVRNCCFKKKHEKITICKDYINDNK